MEARPAASLFSHRATFKSRLTFFVSESRLSTRMQDVKG